MKELDMILGGFGAQFIDTLSEEDLATYALILEYPEKELYQWILGIQTPPLPYQSPLLLRIQEWARGHEKEALALEVPSLSSPLSNSSETEDLFALAHALEKKKGQRILFLAPGEEQAVRMAQNLGFFFNPQNILWFPGWDCPPYQRLSPQTYLMHQRLQVLSRLTAEEKEETLCLVATPGSLSQLLPPLSILRHSLFSLRAGEDIDRQKLLNFLQENGYDRVDLVRQAGEYAVRGSLIDCFPIGQEDSVRLDWFGDRLESIKRIEAESQRSHTPEESVILSPASEVIFTPETLNFFRQAYRVEGESSGKQASLFEAVQQGRRPFGIEQLLPLFYSECLPLWEYFKPHEVRLGANAWEGVLQWWTQVQDHYQGRCSQQGKKKREEEGRDLLLFPPERFYVSPQGIHRFLESYSPRTDPEKKEVPLPRPSFRGIRPKGLEPLMAALKKEIEKNQREGRRVLIACVSEGSRARLKKILEDYEMGEIQEIESWEEARGLNSKSIGLALLLLDQGGVLPNLALFTETEILGERLQGARSKKQTRKALFQPGALAAGDLVVHEDHGIGQYKGLQVIKVQGYEHDCLEIWYGGGDKLFLPVENISLLSRYGKEGEGDLPLDRLGSAAWQARKAKVKNRIEEMAGELLKVAAERQSYEGVVMSIPPDYEAFCARFPYPETQDQLKAIEDVTQDLNGGHPMDRLVCGDVGFGKTEVALRAAFMAVSHGFQVAVVVPTTLLCRQHTRTFEERFQGLGFKVAQLSRLISPSQAAKVRAELHSGKVDIVIATHGILSPRTQWHNLGLMIVDEEHHFGVMQKERLKALKSTIHVLTLSATPLPRTLQMALSGVRELSLIATPPVDRLTVHTYVLPYDPEVIKEALWREHVRGGQVFYVSPRVEDLVGIKAQLKELIPELRVIIAHGKMPAAELDQIMNDFYDHSYDVLLSTTIIESGIDVTNANTLIVHRSDLFGLAQLYQLRGRIGRGKIRGYAYFTMPEGETLSKTAHKRLEVIQGLNYLGAGFALASHDLEIRGSGNLIGKEQSGHIREVGVELYQELLEEALAHCKGEISLKEDRWVPQINAGVSIMISEAYVPDLHLRLSLYRQAGELEDFASIEAFRAELMDRFGPLPEATENLLQVLGLRVLCRQAGIEKVEAGAKGMNLRFRRDQCENSLGLAIFLTQHARTVKLKSDHKIFFMRSWEKIPERLKGIKQDLMELAESLKIIEKKDLQQ
jgi:transcription-repair coupling factor (superfamily II helicase)